MKHQRLSSLNHAIDISFQTLKTLETVDGPPKIEIIKIKDNGLCMVIEDDIQFLESHHESYHEVITHTPCKYIDNFKSILILGGGDGGIATELVKYPSVEEITIIDLSKDVVDLSKKYFPGISFGLLDPRVNIIHDNGCSWVKNHDKKYDLIFIDSTDFNFKHKNETTITQPSCPQSKEANLRDLDNINLAIDLLNKDGILTFNHDFSTYIHSLYVKETFLSQKIAYTLPFCSNIPYFPGNRYCFIMCSNKKFKKFNELDFTKSNINTKVYNRNSHLASLFISKEYEEFFPGLQMDIENC